MNIKYHKTFVKNYKKRIERRTNYRDQYKKRYKLFLQNRSDPRLKDHPLKGPMQGLRAFSITGDIRAIYRVQNKTVEFLDIGTHAQVYGE